MTFHGNDYYGLEDYDRHSDRSPEDELIPADLTHSLDYLAQLDGIPGPGDLAEIIREGREQIEWEAEQDNEDPPTGEEIDLDQFLYYTLGIVPF